MEHDTETPLYNTADKTSFAYPTARDRWPTQVITDLHVAIRDETDSTKAQEGKEVVHKAAEALKYELLHDRVLKPLEDDGSSDIGAYNKELEALGPPRWFSAPWLFAECYLYRRLYNILTLTKHWRNYDPFRGRKHKAFRESLPGIIELAARYHEIVSLPPASDPEVEKLVSIEMMEICLWGNGTDLSLLTSLSYADIQKLQGSEARKQSEKNILVNDLEKVHAVLYAARAVGTPNRRVDIVLDNSGFELYADLILVGYLLHTGLATEIVLHPKSMPWFVSDVIPGDFVDLLNTLKAPEEFFVGESIPPLTEEQKRHLAFVVNHWSELHAEGKLILRSNPFWTLPGSYWRLPHTAPELWEDLKRSELVVFKGDLNYRKLTGDAMWDPTTPFVDAIGPVKDGIRTAALRLCKADVVVGLPPGKDEELRGLDGRDKAREWAASGKWALAQFWDGK